MIQTCRSLVLTTCGPNDVSRCLIVARTERQSDLCGLRETLVHGDDGNRCRVRGGERDDRLTMDRSQSYTAVVVRDPRRRVLVPVPFDPDRVFLPSSSRPRPQLRRIWRLCVGEELNRAFADHDRRCMGVTAGDSWHDRHVHDTESFDPADPELWIDDAVGIATHSAGPDGVVDRFCLFGNEAINGFVGVAVGRLDRITYVLGQRAGSRTARGPRADRSAGLRHLTGCSSSEDRSRVSRSDLLMSTSRSRGFEVARGRARS